MAEMCLSRIKIDEKSKEQVIVLKSLEGDITLPIAIGLNEVTAIKLQVDEFVPERPMTHDLLLDSIKILDARVNRIEINALRHGTFYAAIVILTSSGDEVCVDARPSDSIALALRAKAKIFVADSVLEEAGL